MYRPTVRYDDVYKRYVDQLFHATTLDRNQIIRAALFNSAHSNLYHELLKSYTKGDVPAPSPLWSATDHGLWLEQTRSVDEGGKDVNGSKAKIRRDEATGTDRTGEAGRQQSSQGSLRQVRQNGGIKIFFE